MSNTHWYNASKNSWELLQYQSSEEHEKIEEIPVDEQHLLYVDKTNEICGFAVFEVEL